MGTTIVNAIAAFLLAAILLNLAKDEYGMQRLSVALVYVVVGALFAYGGWMVLMRIVLHTIRML